MTEYSTYKKLQIILPAHKLAAASLFVWRQPLHLLRTAARAPHAAPLTSACRGA